MATPIPTLGSFPLIGLAGGGVGFWEPGLLTCENDILVEGVTGLSMTEETEKIDVPGANARYATKPQTNAVQTTFSFSGMSIPLLSRMLGQRWQVIVDGDNITEITEKGGSDAPPPIRLNALVDWIGPGFPEGDYHWIGYYGTVVGVGNYTHASSTPFSIELTIEWLRHPKTGRFYQMRAAKIGTPLSPLNDITPPALVSSVPVTSASDAAVSGNMTLTLTKSILFRPEDWGFYEVDGLVLTPIPWTSIAIDDAAKVITAVAARSNSTSYRIIGTNISDIHGNIKDSISVSFQTVAP